MPSIESIVDLFSLGHELLPKLMSGKLRVQFSSKYKDSQFALKLVKLFQS
jgi:hypothetical protein